MVTWWPSRPPFRFTSSAHRSYPCTSALPSAEKSPVSDTDTPMVMGVPGEGVAVLVVGPHEITVRPRPATDAIKALRMALSSRPRARLSNAQRLAVNKRLPYVRHG